MLIIKNNHLMSRNSQVALEILEMPFKEQSSIHKQMRTNLQQKQKKKRLPEHRTKRQESDSNNNKTA